LCAATVLTFCLVSAQMLSAQGAGATMLGTGNAPQEGVFGFALRDAGSAGIDPPAATSICLPGDPKCPPPDVTITPPGGGFTTASQTVTIDWCGHSTLTSGTRQIVFGGMDVTAGFSYSVSTKTGCTSHATSTGTISLSSGWKTLSASIEDNIGQLGSKAESFILVQSPLVSLTPYLGNTHDVSKCIANCGGDVVVTYSTPAYRSLDTDRGLTLVYRDEQSHPTGRSRST
jgi:hypothetical protein